jgi:ATP-dependent Zn protease
LAGRAAERVFFGVDKSLNTGASSDLQQATEWAWRMICSYGMEEGQLVVLSKKEVLASPMASEYVARVNAILKEEMENTVAIIEKSKEKIQAIADVLVKENRLTGAQFEELINKK